ncbi:MAG: hypothetical protein RIK87_27780 [Fuerstiella sp.]
MHSQGRFRAKQVADHNSLASQVVRASHPKYVGLDREFVARMSELDRIFCVSETGCPRIERPYCSVLPIQRAAMSAVTTQTGKPQPTVSRRLAAEDIHVGCHITVVKEVCELASFLWFSDTPPEDREQPIKYRHTPGYSGEPYTVLAVCLPFVFAEDIRGALRTFDLRSCEVTQLSSEYVEVVRQKRRKKASGKSRRSGRKKKQRKQ